MTMIFATFFLLMTISS